MRDEAGLGELLRHLGELVDRGSEERYRELGLDYRPRYTPVLRALAAGASTVTEIRNRSHLTQGAVSQTLGLLAEAGILERHDLPDRRKSDLRLTDAGRILLERVEDQWRAIFSAIDALEQEIDYPLRAALGAAVMALERHSFADRLRAAGGPPDEEGALAP